MSSRAAESCTERVTAWITDMPPQPSPIGAIETRPREGFMPKRPEQEAGMRIDVALVDGVPLGVDTPEDLEKARAVLTGRP